MKIFHGPIRKKLVVLVLLATIPVFLVLLGTLLQNRNNAIKLAERDTALYLNGFVEIQRRITNSTQTLLRTVASIPEISILNIEKSRVVLETLLETNPIYTNAILVDLNGNVVAAGRNHDRAKKLNFGDRKQFKEAITSKGLASGEFVLGKSSQKAIFPFGMAVLNNQGEVTGALIIGVNLAHYGKLFERGNYPQSTFFGICDHNGIRLFRYPSNDFIDIGKPIKKKVYDAVATSGEKGSIFAIDSEGKKRIIVFEPLRLMENVETPYIYMFMGFDYEQLQDNANSILNRLLVTSLLSLALALFIAWSIGGKSVARLIENLSLVTKKFSQGEKNVTSNIDYSDGEIGDLAESFDSMVKIIRQREEEKNNLETQLQHAHKMEAVGTLAGGIAHDFNNILSAIIGFAEMAKDDIPADSNAIKDIDQVIKASTRAADLVQHILTFSRMSGHSLEPLEPHLIIKEALKMLRASLPTTIKIQEDIDVNCGKVMADSTNIHQIIVNLCTNSLHAMEKEKGVLSVSLYRKEISDEEIAGEPEVSSGPFMVLEISDTGHGMEQATIEHIFDPYFTTKEVGKGTGLGLSIIHGIIKDYHGFIRVESKLGKGTTFHVYIPALQQETATTGEVKIDTSLPTGTERILVVDDESMIASINKTILERFGYKVTMTTNSLDALEKIRTDPDQFDLIITDQTMPNLTGAELAQRILKIKHNMPIILCTGYSSVLSEEEALAIGMKKYVRKPVDRKTLTKIVRQVLDEN
jgi:signal transduction histidine kinase/CheY-like chemotaxis protein